VLDGQATVADLTRCSCSGTSVRNLSLVIVIVIGAELDVRRTVPVLAHLLGYAWVSTIQQNPDLQVDELTRAGCCKVWSDRASGALDRRPQLDEVLEQLQPGSTLLVWGPDQQTKGVVQAVRRMGHGLQAVARRTRSSLRRSRAPRIGRRADRHQRL